MATKKFIDPVYKKMFQTNHYTKNTSQQTDNTYLLEFGPKRYIHCIFLIFQHIAWRSLFNSMKFKFPE